MISERFPLLNQPTNYYYLNDLQLITKIYSSFDAGAVLGAMRYVPFYSEDMRLGKAHVAVLEYGYKYGTSGRIAYRGPHLEPQVV